MINTLKDLIFATKFDSNQILKISNQTFENEIISCQDLDLSVSAFWEVEFSKVNFSGSYFYMCKFKNCTFKETFMRKCEFINCTFNSCKIVNAKFSSVEFDNTLFIDSQFYKVDLGWSYWSKCIFRKTKFEKVDFEGAILSNLNITQLIVLDSNFTETYPTRFYKSNSKESIDIKSQSNFEKIQKYNS